MKKGILLVLLVVFVFFTHHISTQEQTQTGNKWNGDPDEYNIDWERAPNGIVEGQIIDPDTGKPVDELFWVVFHDIKFIDLERSRSNLKFKVLSDENGFFSRKLLPAQYYVTLHYYIEGESFPGYGEDIKSSEDRKYCADPVLWKNPETAQIITIEKGKVTHIIKHPVIGGDVKFKVVDNLGQKINFKIFFKEEIIVDVWNEKYPIWRGIGTDYDSVFSSTGVAVIKNIPPGNYLGVLHSLNPMGRTYVDIVIEKYKMSEYTLIFDFSTGLEGILIDSENNPISSATIYLLYKAPLEFMMKTNSLHSAINGSIFDTTDNDGKFKFINLVDGTYNLDYRAKSGKISYIGSVYNIVVKKGQIIFKKIIATNN